MNIDAERSLLGSIIRDGKLVYDAQALLNEEDLALDSNRRIYRQMLAMAEIGAPIDLVTLSEQLNTANEVQRIGGYAYLSELHDAALGTGDIGRYAAIVRKHSLRRRTHLALKASLARIEDKSVPAEECIAQTEAELMSLRAAEGDGAGEAIGAFTMATLDQVVARRDYAGELLGIPTGIQSLDEETTGYRDGELTVIGARPGDGKTSLVTQGLRACGNRGIPAAMFSIELAKREVLERIWAAEANVFFSKLRNPRKLSEQELALLKREARRCTDWPVYIDDSAALTATQICARARLLIRHKGVRIVFLDYLQIVEGERADKDEKQRLTRISKALRRLAKTENIPVVALSQLRRPHNDLNERPSKFQLKESGSLEQDAYNVFLLYRPVCNQGNEHTGQDEIIIDKQRNGPTGYVKVKYDGRTLQFRERA